LLSKQEQGSKVSPPPLPKEDGDEVPDEDEWYHVCLKLFILVLIVFGAPYICHSWSLSSATRCIVVIAAVLIINLAEVMPLFCTALFIPVLGTMCRVLGDSRSTVATSTLLVGSIFNNISFLVLGALVINGIFVKCRLERKLMALLLKTFSPHDKFFLLFLLLGSMAMCSILYSGSLVLLAALRPIILPVNEKDEVAPNIAKRLLLAVAFSANAGSVWLPISSPVNLITMALLQEFDYNIRLIEWIMVSIPFSTITVIMLWFVMLYVFPDTSSASTLDPSVSHRSAAVIEEALRFSQAEEEEMEEASIQLTSAHYFFLAVSVVALLSITVFMPFLEPIFGHGSCISLIVVVAAFGSGFMTRDEFLNLDWDLLMLVGGTNVMAFMVRETGLGAELSAKLVSSELFTMLPYWGLLVLLIIGTVTISTTVGHTLTGVLLLPLVVALGLKLQAAETTALLCAIAIPFGMGLPQSSFDNSSAYTESRKYDRPQVVLKQRDFRIPGVAITIVAVFVLLFLGYGVCVFNFGMPPPVVVSEVSETPEKLKPKIVTENRPEEAGEVSYNKMMGDWKSFEKKPDHKAFAVGKLKKDFKTRPWAASWNHETQEDANKAAMEECERIAGECRLIYPSRQESFGKEAHDLKKAVEKKDQEDQKTGAGDGTRFLVRSPRLLSRRTFSKDAHPPKLKMLAHTLGTLSLDRAH
jgi:di/tricarboxylate transporter